MRKNPQLLEVTGDEKTSDEVQVDHNLGATIYKGGYVQEVKEQVRVKWSEVP